MSHDATGRAAVMRFEVFRATSFTTWEALFQSVADFATDLGRDRVVTISHSEDRGSAVVTVWFWED